SFAENQGQTQQGGHEGGFQRSPAEMERFRAIRDSLQAAHGGNLSPDELRAEMRKMFAARMSGRTQPVLESVAKPRLPKTVAQYGIVSNFPEYQKGSYDPSEDSGRGRVWILKPNGLLQAVFVRTGLNDGRYTEIFSPNLHPGDQIVLGATSNGESGAVSPNPLAGGQQRGGFR
ncbi:MAG TPA: hypothetical protein VI758_03915, partial [Bacteroidota bacterium]